MFQVTTEDAVRQAAMSEARTDRGKSRLHQHQFVIGPRPVNNIPGWVSIQLEGIGYFSHCPELRVQQAVDAKNNPRYLLGLAVQTAENSPDPLDGISTATPETIADLYQSWAGRWALLGAGSLHMDACGLLGCFYGIGKVSVTGIEFWVSSSPAILAEILGVETQLIYRIEHGFGIDWFVPPRSGIKSISRLLSSQVLDLSCGAVSRRRMLASLPKKLDYDEVLDAMQAYFVTTFKNLSRVSDQLWLALTAGNDSRTLLAAAKHAGVPVKPFTHGHNGLSNADATFPPKLAKAVGMEHTFFTGGEYNAELEELYDRHTAGHTVDMDRFYFSHDFFRWCRKGDIVIRSQTIEMGRGLRKRFPIDEYGAGIPDADVLLESYKKRGFKYVGRDPENSFPPIMYKAMEEWVAWCRGTPPGEIGWRDQWFIEQGHGGWLSSIEQSLDLTDTERFYPTNSQLFFAIALQISEDKCLYKKPVHQHELIRRMAPELLEFPFNPDDPVSLPRRILGKVRGLAQRIAGKED